MSDIEDDQKSQATAVPEYTDNLEYRIVKRARQTDYMKHCLEMFIHSTTNLPLIMELWNVAKRDPIYLKEFDEYFGKVVEAMKNGCNDYSQLD